MGKIKNVPEKHITRAVLGGSKTVPVVKVMKSLFDRREFHLDRQGYFIWKERAK